jgi:serine/threonine protein kinase
LISIAPGLYQPWGVSSSRRTRSTQRLTAMVAPSSRIGPYTVLKPLGAGGMAETFVAERRGPGAFVQRVCLKRIRAELESDPELVRQFMAEAAIAARLRHTNIASVLDFGEDQGVLYMAIELIDGVDLREVIKHAPSGLPSALVIYVAVELCTALDVAHGAPSGSVIHRDVSPSNVLVSTEGEVKLADFGIARAEETPSHTRTGIVRGKVPYMAPEYARTGRFDARADLFSLGVLLHECAYGSRPFDGATDLETLERATRGERWAVPERSEPLPEAFVTVLDHLLAPEPDQRFASGGAALEAMLSLPSDPRARRELGARVTAIRGPVTHDDSYASTQLAAARPSDPLAATRTLASASRPALPRRRGPLLALRAAAGTLLIAAALWLGKQAVPSMAEHALEPIEPPAPVLAAQAPAVDRPPPDPVLRPTTAEPSVQSATAASSSPLDAGHADQAQDQAASLGTLKVIVLPYGTVFVNDELAGDAAKEIRLRPGSYAVRVVTPNGVYQRRVELRAGKTTRVRF